MAPQPRVCAQAQQHVLVGQRTELQAHQCRASLWAFVVYRGHHRPRRVGRSGVAVEEREHVGAPPCTCLRQLGRRVAARIDLFAVTIGAEAGVDVDPACVRGRDSMLAQDGAHGAVAPRWRGAAVEQTVGHRVLADSHGSAIGTHAMRFDVRGHGDIVSRGRRPGRRQHERLDISVARVHRQRRTKVDEVAVQVDVVLVGAVQVRKAVRVDRVNQQQGDVRFLQSFEQVGIVQRRDLAARTAEAFGAVGARGDDQQLLCIGCAEAGHVGGELFAQCTAHVVHDERFDAGASLCCGVQELAAGFDVGSGKMSGGCGALHWALLLRRSRQGGNIDVDVIAGVIHQP